ncbi:MAG TPA: hypothetical protein PLA68_11975 [Panacibacter sp.]|nr:hypothetical protein [Panacibacter sp.]
MKNKLSFVAICSVFLFMACSKNNSLKNGEVQIRVENTTTDNFQNIVVGTTGFGSINAGAVTDYQRFEKVVIYPVADLVTASGTVNAGYGYCGTPPLPYLESGRYKLQIFYDTAIYSHYNARYIKE